MHISAFNLGLGLLALIYTVSIVVSIRILLENRNPAKTTAYLMLIYFVPIIGLPVYYFFGINYRTKKRYATLPAETGAYLRKIRKSIIEQSNQLIAAQSNFLKTQVELSRLLLKEVNAGLTNQNNVELLFNGEQKFARLIEDLNAANHHIHLEYYIVENDIIGNEIKDILIRKSKAGVAVRFIYDDFGAKQIRGKFLTELKAAGVEIFPFNNLYFAQLANRLNYRNHRKIVVIDGNIGYVGGINVSDRYINPNKTGYWRDTHVRLHGQAVHWLQAYFILHNNFSSEKKLTISEAYFPEINVTTEALVQIAGSGPDSERATLMLAFFTAIVGATERVYITTPYLIPNESIITALKQAVLSGLDVRLLVPKNSDSFFVNAASQSFFNELLEAGVKIYQYDKGFIHAKTMVIDNNLAIVGTANMDIRSFDLNFEINAFIYDTDINQKLADTFMDDLKNSTLINIKQWKQRKRRYRVAESVARLIAPLL
jgi:cardiolipin synthase